MHECALSGAKPRCGVSYAHPRASGRRLTAVLATIALHIVLIYALLHGLARKIVEVAPAPLQTMIIEEARPSRAERPLPPPPKLAAAPRPFLPPPELNIQVPQPPPARTAVTAAPKPAPAPVAPAPAASAEGPVHTPAVVDAASCGKPDYPSASRRANETGTVLLSFLIDEDGKVVESKVERSSGYRRLDDAAREALGLCKFRPATENGKPMRAWARLEYVWTLE
jgi:periplasmic protein TonB